MRYFLAAAEKGSFAKAARAAHVSQPSLSTQMQALEAEFQTKLFERTPRGVRLTPAGSRVRASVERILGEIAELEHDLGEDELSPFRAVRLGVQPLIASCFLPSILRTYLESQPGIQVTIVERTNALLPELILRGEVHLGLMTREDVIPRSLDVLPLTRFRYHVFASDPRALARRPRWRLADLVQLPSLVFRDPANIDERLADIASRRGTRPSILFLSDQAVTVLEMCALGMGIAILPSIVETKASSMGLASAPLHEPDLSCRMILCRKRRASLPDSAEHFAEFLVEQRSRRTRRTQK